MNDSISYMFDNYINGDFNITIRQLSEAFGTTIKDMEDILNQYPIPDVDEKQVKMFNLFETSSLSVGCISKQVGLPFDQVVRAYLGRRQCGLESYELKQLRRSMCLTITDITRHLIVNYTNLQWRRFERGTAAIPYYVMIEMLRLESIGVQMKQDPSFTPNIPDLIAGKLRYALSGGELAPLMNGSEIRELRGKLNLTVEECAEYIAGVQRVTWGKYENNDVDVSDEINEKLIDCETAYHQLLNNEPVTVDIHKCLMDKISLKVFSVVNSIDSDLVRKYRKQLNLGISEAAFLIGGKAAVTWGKYEHGSLKIPAETGKKLIELIKLQNRYRNGELVIDELNALNPIIRKGVTS